MSEKKLVVAVVGATGAVGREMLKTLESRNFPATEVVPFASARSAGTKVPYGDSELVVRELKEDVFEGIDIAIFSAGGSTSEKMYPLAVDAAGEDPTYVGRIREDDTIPNGLNMWIVADNIRKGAALNAVQIAEELVRRDLLGVQDRTVFIKK